MTDESLGKYSNYKTLARVLGIGSDTMQKILECPGVPAKPWDAAMVGDFIINRCDRVNASTKKQVAASLGLSLTGTNAIDSDEADLYLGANSPNLERLRKYKADIEHHKLLEIQGELVRLEDYLSAERQRHVIAKGLVDTLRQILPGKVYAKTIEEITDIVNREIDNVCRAIADGLSEAASETSNAARTKKDKQQDIEPKEATSETE